MNTTPRQVLKYCSKCGSKNTSYRPNNSLYCFDCHFQSFINEVSAVACVIQNSNGAILLTERKNAPQAGKYDLPGGFVDLGEKAEEAVCRELNEELSITVTDIQYISSYPNEYIYSGITVYTLDLCFLCKIDSFENLQAKDDVQSFQFCSIENINLEDIAFNSVRNILTDPLLHTALKQS